MINKISSLYFVLIFLIVYVPDWQVIDIKSVQFYYLSIVNTLFLSFLFFKKDFFRKINDPITVSFASLFIMSTISVFYSLNRYESLTKLSDLFTILSTLIISMYIIKTKMVKIKSLLFLFLFSLLADVAGVFYLYLQVLEISDYNFQQTGQIKAFYGNRNITSLVIAFKIPIVIYLSKYINKNFLKGFIFILLCFAFFVLLLLSSRAIMLSTIIVLLTVMALLLIKKVYYKNTIYQDFKFFANFFTPIIISIIVFNLTVDQEDEVSLNNRLTSIVENENDRSSIERLRFYKGAISYIVSNPFLGCGIGNWRILSIKYDSENMYSYVVPYFAHNDFIEIFAETGIIGFASYLMFFVFIFKINLKNIIDWIHSKSGFESLLLFLPFIYYFIDSNLNFPLDRSSVQINFLIYISLLYLHNLTLKQNG